MLQLTADVMARLSIRQVFTAPCHPQSNSVVVERLNGTFTSMVEKYINEDQADWDLNLPFVTRAYNTSVHETTKASLYWVVFGSEPESLLDRFLASDGTCSKHTTWGTDMREVHDSVLDDLRSDNVQVQFCKPFFI